MRSLLPHMLRETQLQAACLVRKSALQGIINPPCKLISVTDSRLKAWCNLTLHLYNVFYEPSPVSLLRDWFIHRAQAGLTIPWWATKSFVHFIAGESLYVLVLTTVKEAPRCFIAASSFEYTWALSGCFSPSISPWTVLRLGGCVVPPHSSSMAKISILRPHSSVLPNPNRNHF